MKYHEHCRACGAPIEGTSHDDIPRVSSLEPALKGGQLVGLEMFVACCAACRVKRDEQLRKPGLIIAGGPAGSLPA